MNYSKYLLVYFSFFITALSCAQNSFPMEIENLNSAKQYISQHILELEAIEGVYDIENTVHASAGHLSDTRRQNFTWVILDLSRFDKSSSHKYVVYSVDGDFDGLIGYIQVLQQGSYYMFESIDGNGHKNHDRFMLEQGLSFKITRENHFRGYGSVINKTIGIKTYPTVQMYQEAIKMKSEAESKPTMWSGTGFALAENHIVTNYHVVEEAKNIYIQGINGDFNNKYKASVVATDKFNDLAILKVDGANISTSIPYSVNTTTSEVGEEVFVLGYPLTSTMGDEIKLTTGIISSKSGFQGDMSLYQISAPIQPGNSGGPLFDSKGNIIGIVSAKHQGAENVGYAIKTSYLKNLIESTIPTNILPQNNKISSLNLSGKVKAVKDFVYFIVCFSETSNSPTNNTNVISPSDESEESDWKFYEFR